MIAALALAHLLLSQEKKEPVIKAEIGFVRITFFSPKGTITVILPDDVCPGDLISGTVFPSSKDFNLGDLQLDLGDAHAVSADPTGQRRSWTVPKTTEPRLSFTAWTTDGKLLGTTFISMGNPKPKPEAYTFPFSERIGSPFVVKGPYSGDAANTVLKANDVSIPVVAESPRQAVALVPSQTLPGEGPLEVIEDGLHAKAMSRFLSINLTTPKTSLAKGEQTDLKITVEGILGVADSQIPMIVVENLSPKVIDLDGKAKHFLFAKPSKDGDYSHSFTVTSLLAGSFSVSAVVDPGVGTRVVPTK